MLSWAAYLKKSAFWSGKSLKSSPLLAGWVPLVEEDGCVLVFAVVVEEGDVDPSVM